MKIVVNAQAFKAARAVGTNIKTETRRQLHSVCFAKVRDYVAMVATDGILLVKHDLKSEDIHEMPADFERVVITLDAKIAASASYITFDLETLQATIEDKKQSNMVVMFKTDQTEFYPDWSRVYDLAHHGDNRFDGIMGIRPQYFALFGDCVKSTLGQSGFFNLTSNVGGIATLVSSDWTGVISCGAIRAMPDYSPTL